MEMEKERQILHYLIIATYVSFLFYIPCLFRSHNQLLSCILYFLSFFVEPLLLIEKIHNEKENPLHG